LLLFDCLVSIFFTFSFSNANSINMRNVMYWITLDDVMEMVVEKKKLIISMMNFFLISYFSAILFNSWVLYGLNCMTIKSKHDDKCKNCYK